MKKHPYLGLADQQFWKREPALEDPALLDPFSDPRFQITDTDKIVTAGSCFAQHIAKVLCYSGHNYHVTEKAHPMFSKAEGTANHYGTFSARYGNIYTGRQLNQMLLRAFDEWAPIDWFWPSSSDGTRVVDPIRPNVQPGGFYSSQELKHDIQVHSAAVRAAIESMDVFIFTLGLTECWVSKQDGTVFPLPPGVAGGVWDPNDTHFRNFTLEETTADLQNAIQLIRSINPEVKIILTVSPVALNATFERRHVLLSTTWSKAVLRLAAEELTNRFNNLIYFPSYEIITSPHSRGRYFSEDCRSVTQGGVDHVMRVFLKHFSTIPEEKRNQTSRPAPVEQPFDEYVEMAISAFCDEELLDNTAPETKDSTICHAN